MGLEIPLIVYKHHIFPSCIANSSLIAGLFLLTVFPLQSLTSNSRRLYKIDDLIAPGFVYQRSLDSLLGRLYKAETTWYEFSKRFFDKGTGKEKPILTIPERLYKKSHELSGNACQPGCHKKILFNCEYIYLLMLMPDSDVRLQCSYFGKRFDIC